jgi:hypothetical protein
MRAASDERVMGNKRALAAIVPDLVQPQSHHNLRWNKLSRMFPARARRALLPHLRRALLPHLIWNNLGTI